MNRLDRFSFLCAAPVLLVLVLALPVRSHAQGGCLNGGSGGCTSVPEIDPSLGGGGLALVAGAAVVVRARRRS